MAAGRTGDCRFGHLGSAGRVQPGRATAAHSFTNTSSAQACATCVAQRTLKRQRPAVETGRGRSPPASSRSCYRGPSWSWRCVSPGTCSATAPLPERADDGIASRDGHGWRSRCARRTRGGMRTGAPVNRVKPRARAAPPHLSTSLPLQPNVAVLALCDLVHATHDSSMAVAASCSIQLHRLVALVHQLLQASHHKVL